MLSSEIMVFIILQAKQLLLENQREHYPDMRVYDSTTTTNGIQAHFES